MDKKIKVGITHGDINGVGYEIILKTFEAEEMFQICTPVVYGSPKVATYHKKALECQTNFNVRNSADDILDNNLNLINCFGETELKINYGMATEESGKAAFLALNQAMNDLKDGKIDVLVTAPLCKSVIKGKESVFPGHTTYIEKRLGEGSNALEILVSPEIRIALATSDIPLNKVAESITADLIKDKLTVLNDTLKRDFCVDGPRIAVLSLNPDYDANSNVENEDTQIIAPAISELFSSKKVRCFGPYPAESFFSQRHYTHFDAVLAMYYDQGIVPFNSISLDGGIKYTAGLPVVHTEPAHGTEYDIAGKNAADPSSLRMAIYDAIDILRQRDRFDQAHAHPLRRQYYEKRDDSDKLKLDQVTENDTL